MYENPRDRERKIFFSEKTLSTNSDLKKMIYSAESPVFAVISAKEQSGGRGRLGKSFFSPEGGLYFSVSFPLTGEEKNIPFLTLLAGLAVSEAIEDITGIKTEIKWPNDIYLGTKKLGGILCELVSTKQLTAVAGIGINLGTAKNEIPPELSDIMTSFAAQGLPIPDKAALIKAICERLDRYIYVDKELSSVKKTTLDAIKERSYSIGKRVRYTVGDSVLEGIVTDITLSGAAVISLSDGSVKEIFCGEITQ